MRRRAGGRCRGLISGNKNIIWYTEETGLKKEDVLIEAHPLCFIYFIRLGSLAVRLDGLPDASGEGGTNEGTHDENP